MTIFDFFKVRFLGFYKLRGNQRTYLYSGGSGLSIDIHFVDIELSYDVLSPLPTLLSKHFNHPHPYIEIATAISDTRIYALWPQRVNHRMSPDWSTTNPIAAFSCTPRVQ